MSLQMSIRVRTIRERIQAGDVALATLGLVALEQDLKRAGEASRASKRWKR